MRINWASKRMVKTFLEDTAGNSCGGFEGMCLQFPPQNSTLFFRSLRLFDKVKGKLPSNFPGHNDTIDTVSIFSGTYEQEIFERIWQMIMLVVAGSHDLPCHSSGCSAMSRLIVTVAEVLSSPLLCSGLSMGTVQFSHNYSSGVWPMTPWPTVTMGDPTGSHWYHSDDQATVEQLTCGGATPSSNRRKPTTKVEWNTVKTRSSPPYIYI